MKTEAYLRDFEQVFSRVQLLDQLEKLEKSNPLDLLPDGMYDSLLNAGIMNREQLQEEGIETKKKKIAALLKLLDEG